MTARPAYLVILLALLLPPAYHLLAYDGRGGLLPYQLGLAATSLIAYGMLVAVGVHALIQFVRTFWSRSKHSYSRFDLAIRITVIAAVFVIPAIHSDRIDLEWTSESLAKTVKFDLDGYRYSVPARYLYRVWSKGRITSSIELVALYPDFQGKAIENRQEFESVKDGQGKRVQIDLTIRTKPHPDFLGRYGDFTNKAIFLQHTLALYAESGLTRPINVVHGLDYYGKRHTSELYVATNHPEHIYYTCNEDRGPGYYPSCKTEYPYRGNVVIKYRFRKTYLSDWPSIHSHVQALLKQIDSQS